MKGMTITNTSTEEDCDMIVYLKASISNPPDEQVRIPPGRSHTFHKTSPFTLKVEYVKNVEAKNKSFDHRWHVKVERKDKGDPA